MAARPAATPLPKRLGPEGLRRLDDQLTDRDLAVLEDVAQLRLVTGRQLQRLHFGSSDADARATRRLLTRLTTHRLLTRLDRRVGGVLGGSAAHCYVIGPVGDRVLRARSETPLPRRRDADVGDGHAAHTLAIAELVVELRERHRGGPDELVSITTEPRSWRRLPGLERQWLKPDLIVVTAHQDDELHHWVEVDRGTEHRPALIKKFRAYEDVYQAGDEARTRGVFPRVLWVVPTPKRAQVIGELALRASGVTAGLHITALPHEAVAVLFGGEIPDHTSVPP